MLNGGYINKVATVNSIGLRKEFHMRQRLSLPNPSHATIIGNFSNDHSDGNENVTKVKGLFTSRWGTLGR